MINGEEFAWEDVSAAMLGRIVEGCTEVEYTTEREFNEIYGRGADPHSLGRGKRKYDGRLVMLQSEVEAIQQTLGRGKNLTDLKPFDVTVCYAAEEGARVTDVLKNCRVKQVKKAFKNDDGNMVIELPLAMTKILYNV